MKGTPHAAVFVHEYGEEAYDGDNNPIPGSDTLYGVWLVERGEVEDDHGQVEEGWVRDPNESWGEFPTEAEATAAAKSAGLRLITGAHWSPYEEELDE